MYGMNQMIWDKSPYSSIFTFQSSLLHVVSYIDRQLTSICLMQIGFDKSVFNVYHECINLLFLPSPSDTITLQFTIHNRMQVTKYMYMPTF